MSDNLYQRKIPPKKSLGQHFLKDQSIAMDIAEILPENGLPVLEIGPGTGALTEHLLPVFKENLYVVEIDSRSIQYLNQAFPVLQHNIFEQDFLQMNLQEHFPEGVNIIGNFPYNISSQILFKVFDQADLVPHFAGMFQKEVAQRICADYTKKQYGQLSVIRQLYYDAEYLFDVEGFRFDPPPKVVSGVIHLQRNKKQLEVAENQLKVIIKTAFSKRRKMLRNSLKPFFTEEQLKDELFRKRPENIELSDFVKLTQKASF